MKQKWSKFSKKRQYFLIICVKSNLFFCRKEIWSFLKVLDYQILEEVINLRLKCSFLILVQVTPKNPSHPMPFYGRACVVPAEHEIENNFQLFFPDIQARREHLYQKRPRARQCMQVLCICGRAGIRGQLKSLSNSLQCSFLCNSLYIYNTQEEVKQSSKL